MARSRRRKRWLVGLGVAMALLGHWFYWYSPREREVAPSAPFARLLDGDGNWDRVLWIAYPHQNLGAVDQALGSLDDYLVELARVAEIRAPRVPRFGPFSVPPARELALAWNDSESEVVGVARVYTGIAWAARLAGKLAGNPWLSGGAARSGDREYRVRWEGGLWIVQSDGAPDFTIPSSESAASRSEPALAEARLTRQTGPVAPGNFRLARFPEGIEVRGGSLPATALDPIEDGKGTGALRLDLPALALWVAVSDRGPLGGPGLFLLWEDKESIVPRVAVLQRGGGQTFRLPGEDLLDLLGRGEPARRLGWTARGTDRQARREALRVVPWLERNYPRASRENAWLAAAGRLAPRRASGMLQRLADRLRAIPLVPVTEIDRVEAGARLLRPLVECPRVTFEVWRNPDGVRVRLCPSGSSESAADLERELSLEEDAQIDESSRIR